MRSETYNTKQKSKIIDLIKNEKGSFVIKDLYAKLNEEIGLTTIYRLVDKLVLEGMIVKEISKDNITSYRYLEKCDKENHFYLKCENCGEVKHVDCDCIEELSKHIKDEHRFNLTNHVIINGVCKKCKDKRG